MADHASDVMERENRHHHDRERTFLDHVQFGFEPSNSFPLCRHAYKAEKLPFTRYLMHFFIMIYDNLLK
jgi:hypothetical protein